jgi:two-component system, NtrC family, sensor kinase
MAAMVSSAARLCDAYDAGIGRVEGNVLRLVAHDGPITLLGPLGATVPIARGTVMGRAILERQAIQVADAQEGEEYPEGRDFARRLGHRTILAVPLVRAGEAIGVIVLRRTEVRPFTDRQIELLKTFADQAVIAIENTRLFEAEQTRTWELQPSLEYQTATSDVLNIIGRSPTNVRPVFDVIAKSAAQLCAAQFCHVFRFDGELIHFAASYGLPAEAIALIRRGYPMLPGQASISGRTILSGAVEEIADVDSDAAYGRAPTARAIGYRSIVAVPMLTSAQPIGAIVVGRAEPGRFLARQIELLKTFADQAVIAIENTRLFEAEQSRTRELTERTRELPSRSVTKPRPARCWLSSVDRNSIYSRCLRRLRALQATFVLPMM